MDECLLLTVSVVQKPERGQGPGASLFADVRIVTRADRCYVFSLSCIYLVPLFIAESQVMVSLLIRLAAQG